MGGFFKATPSGCVLYIIVKVNMGRPNPLIRPTSSLVAPLSGVRCYSKTPGPLGISGWVQKNKPNPKFLTFDPFPYIHGRHGGQSFLYREAIRDFRSFQRIETEFGENYKLIIILQSEATMKLDETGKLTMGFGTLRRTGKSLNKFESNILKTVNVLDRAPPLLSKGLTAIVGNIETLLKIQKDIDERDLIIHQAGKRKSEADKKKLIFSMRTLAASQASFSYAKRYIYLRKKFLEYERKRHVLSPWIAMEQKLSGRTSETKMWWKRKFL